MKPRSLIVLFFLLPLCALGMELPDPPAGYSWRKCPKTRGALLIPDGWFFHEVQSKEVTAYFVTKEEIGDSLQYKTGLSMNIVRHAEKSKGMAVSEYIDRVLQNVKKDPRCTSSMKKSMGPFRAVLFRIKDPGEDGDVVIVHNLWIANDKTGTLYVVLFEAPESEWDRAYEVGEPILQNLLIDDEI